MSHITANNTSTATADHVATAPEASRETGLFRRLLGWLSGTLPTLAVVALLAGIGAYGHFHHWMLPSYAELTGAVAPATQDWCEEHGVPESTCINCNPGLMPPGPNYGWCTEHGVHNCTLHHPDVAQMKELPELTEADWNRAADALALRERLHNNAACKAYQKRIQFTSNDAVQQAGVDVELVGRQSITETVTGNGEIRYDATRFANLSSRAAGTVWKVFKNIGDPVRKDEVVAVVDAMEVGRLKGVLLKAIVEEGLARENAERLNNLIDGAVARKEVLKATAALKIAETEVLIAEQALANLGLEVDASSLSEMDRKKMIESLHFAGFVQELSYQIKSESFTANLIPVRSPMDGVVVGRNMVPGEVVETSRTLLELADPSQMWLILNIPLEEVHVLNIGQTVHFQANGSQREVTGKLSWISTAADKQTRMVQVRAELPNEDGQLRDETFGAGRIVLREEPEAIVVPQQAVHWEGCCQVVFVRDKNYFSSPESPKVFQLRSVRTGAKQGEMAEVIAGLLPGEVVVTEGSDVLRAQLLKNSLGEGCCAE